MQLIGLTGYARSGKDTVAKILCDEFGYTRFAFADNVRKACELLDPYIYIECDIKEPMFMRLSEAVDLYGWDQVKKNPDGRRMLQRCGTELGRNLISDNLWVELVEKQIQGYERIVISDVRFPNEADWIKSVGGKIAKIKRFGNHGIGTSHASEQYIDSIESDLVIENYSTVDDLKRLVCSLHKKKFICHTLV